MRYSIVIALAIITLPASAQEILWNTPLKNNVEYTIHSPNGAYLILIESHRRTLVMRCLDTQSGKELWSKVAEDFPKLEVLQKEELWRFLDDSTLFIGMNRRYEWINPIDGASYKSIPIAGKDWDDMVIREDPNYPIMPVLVDEWAIFYFDDGTQVLDLPGKRLAYEGEITRSYSSGVYREEYSGNIVLIPCDSILYFNTDTKTIVFKDAPEFNSTVYQHFFVHGSLMLLFNEDNIKSIDLKTGGLNALIPVDPDDPDYYRPVTINGTSYLLAGMEDVQKLYDTKDGRLVWQTEQGYLPGYIDEVVPIGENASLCTYYGKNGEIGLVSIDMTSGRILWKRTLGKQTGDYFPGHRRKSGLAAIAIGSFLTSVALNVVSKGTAGPGGSYYTFSADFSGSLYRSQESMAVLRCLSVEDNAVCMLIAGRFEALPDMGVPRGASEYVFMINPQDGTIQEPYPVNVIMNAGMDKYNASAEMADVDIYHFEKGVLVRGADALIVAQDGKVSTISTGFCHILSKSDDTLLIMTTGHDKDERIILSYWMILPFAYPPVRQLVGRTIGDRYFRNVDFTSLRNCLNVTEEEVSGFGFVEGYVPGKYFSSPKWKYTNEELGIGSMRMDKEMEDNRSFYPIQGATVADGNIILMGDDGIVFISADGTCHWSKEWDVDYSDTRLGLLPFDNAFAYATGNDLSIYEMVCPVRLLYHKDIPFNKLDVRHFGSEKKFYVIKHGDYIECVHLP